jgi:hypothetical protein
MLRRMALVVITRATRCNVPEDTILHSHRRENLKSYNISLLYACDWNNNIFRKFVVCTNSVWVTVSKIISLVNCSHSVSPCLTGGDIPLERGQSNANPLTFSSCLEIYSFSWPRNLAIFGINRSLLFVLLMAFIYSASRQTGRETNKQTKSVVCSRKVTLPTELPPLINIF